MCSLESLAGKLASKNVDGALVAGEGAVVSLLRGRHSAAEQNACATCAGVCLCSRRDAGWILLGSREAFGLRIPNHIAIDGNMTGIAERREAIRQFQEDDDTMVFVGNPAPAGAGLTLHRASARSTGRG